MHLVSVIIPTYKSGDYIYKCFESLAVQTCGNAVFEVVVVLNGERDPYYDTIAAALEKHKFNYKLFYTDIPGVSNARNIALDYVANSNTSYVTFLDDDDRFSPSFIEECLKKAQPEVIVVSNTKTFVENTDEKLGDDYLSSCFKRNQGKEYNIVNYRSFLSTVCAKLIPLAVIGKTRFDTQFAIGEDSLFGFEISGRINKMNLTDEKAVYLRGLRPLSASRKKQKKIPRILGSLGLCKKYSQVYFRHWGQYNFKLYITRILAEMQYIFKILIH